MALAQLVHCTSQRRQLARRPPSAPRLLPQWLRRLSFPTALADAVAEGAAERPDAGSLGLLRLSGAVAGLCERAAGEREELTRLRGVARQLEDGGDHGEAERGREVVRVVCGEELGEAAEALLGGQARERSGIGDDGVSGMSGTFAVIRAITVSRTIGIVSFIGTI